MSLVPESDIQAFIENNKSWMYQDNSIMKEITFDTYMDGIAFVNSLAEKAEEANHHPDLEVGWCRVKVVFTSHDLGGVTAMCIEMAEYVDGLFGNN